MKSNSTLSAKILQVTAKELNEDSQYSFDVYEFSNGLILVFGETTNDWFFEDREAIEPCGTAVIASIEETDQIKEFTAESLFKSVQGSMGEFGIDSVPAKHCELWRKSNGSK